MTEHFHMVLTFDEANLIQRVRRAQRVRELDGPPSLVNQCNQFVAERLRNMLGAAWEDSALAAYQRDLEDAAGECSVPTPEPGSHMAKVLQENRLMRQRIDFALEAINFQLSPSDDEGEDAVEVEDRMPTLYERLGDDDDNLLLCEKVRCYLLSTLGNDSSPKME